MTSDNWKLVGIVALILLGSIALAYGLSCIPPGTGQPASGRPWPRSSRPAGMSPYKYYTQPWKRYTHPW